MSNLVDRIAALEEVIDGYESDLKNAMTPKEKSELRKLITASRETLNRLLDEKKILSQPQAAPQAGFDFTTIKDMVEKIGNEYKLAVEKIGNENKLVVGEIRRKLNKGNELTPTPATVGLKAIANLKEFGRDTQFSPVTGSACLLDEEEIHSVSKLSDEHDLVMKLQTKLASVFPGFAVVNSELFPWLVCGGNRQKPDLFICPIPFYTKKIPADTVKYPSSYRYGTVEDIRLYKAVVLIDAKLTLTDAAFGELGNHMEYLSVYCDAPARGMLIGKNEFWLYEQQNKVSVRRIIASYSDEGSLDLVKEFFHAILNPYSYLNQLCRDLNVEYADPFTSSLCINGFLGQGGNGTVIKVISDDAASSARARNRHLCALKFVVAEKAGNLNAELDLLKKHADNCGCRQVVTPISTECKSAGNFCGYVMREVGRCSCTRELIQNGEVSIKTILNALMSLHTHKPVITHGDARLPNLILLQCQPVELSWVDMMCSSSDLSNPQLNIKRDMVTLVESILGCYCNAEVLEAIDLYSFDVNQGKLNSLSDVVQKVFCF